MLFLALTFLARLQGANVGPVQKVIQLLGGLQQKVITEGESQQANFEEFSRWCERQNIEKTHSIKAMQQEILGLKSTIDTASANFEQLNAAIGELTSQISANEKQLEGIEAQRDEEHKQFLQRDADLGETIDMLVRASNVLKKSLRQADAQGKTSLMQTSSMKVVTDTLRALIHASFVSIEDQKVMQSLLQQSSATDAWSLEPQASTSAYKSQSGGILDVMSGLQDKAEESRNAGQREEMGHQHSFEMLKQSIQAELKAFQAQLDDSKKKKSRQDEVRATAEGDLENVEKDLAADQTALEDIHRECMNRAQEFENNQKSRAEELKVLAEAKKVLAGAPEDSRFLQTQNKKAMPKMGYSSFLQMKSAPDMYERQVEAADYLRQEGSRLNSWILAQVGQKVQGDAFTKVKKMIQAMVAKLLEEQASEAEHKQWCDQEFSKSNQAKEKKSDKVDDIQTKIDQASSLHGKRSKQIEMLLAELAEMDLSQDESIKLRQKEHEEFVANRAALTSGQQAVATAIKVLRNYYQGSFIQAPTGGDAATGIIGMLEVAESDFSRSLAEATAQEDEAQEEFDKQTQDYKVAKAAKGQDVKNKTAEKERFANLVNETTVDVRDAQAELKAVVEYLEKLKGDCETKAPAFEERQARRQREMEGLQNALAILEGKGVALLDVPHALSSFS